MSNEIGHIDPTLDDQPTQQLDCYDRVKKLLAAKTESN